MISRAAVAATVAVTVSAAFLAAAPSIGELRSWMRAAFPGWFGVVVNLLAGLCVAAAAAAAIARVRDRRVLRFALIAGALAVAATSAMTMAAASGSQNAVERFHFVQYGLVTWLWYRVVRRLSPQTADLSTLLVPGLVALVVGAADEAVQWFVPERVGEYRDIFYNGTAIVAGLLWSAGVDPPQPFAWRLAPRSRRMIVVAGAAAMASTGAFIGMAQSGHVVRDNELGVAFASRYTADDLRTLAEDRAARWVRDPPPLQIRRYSREDQYVAEALWHIRARNDAWERAPAIAWHENLILERYFAPVLDTPSYSAAVSRWPEVQRRDADRRRGMGGNELFMSDANPLEILIYVPRWIWGGFAALLLLGGLLTLREWWPRGRRRRTSR